MVPDGASPGIQLFWKALVMMKLKCWILIFLNLSEQNWLLLTDLISQIT